MGSIEEAELSFVLIAVRSLDMIYSFGSLWPGFDLIIRAGDPFPLKKPYIFGKKKKPKLADCHVSKEAK